MSQRKRLNPAADSSILEDPARLTKAAERAFAQAARAAVAENDRMGIATHGAVAGKLVTRSPGSPANRR